MLSWFNQIKQTFIFNFIEGNRWKYITNGLLVTLEVTLFALLIGLCIGVVVAMIRSSYDKNRDEMRPGFGKAVQIYSFLTAQKDVGIPIAEAEKPDVVIQNFEEFLDWLDRENPAMALK